MDRATAGAASSYQVTAETIRKAKKKTIISFKPVNFTVSYAPATETVSIHLKSSKPFTKGGRIVISGVINRAGAPLSAADNTLVILPSAKGITLA